MGSWSIWCIGCAIRQLARVVTARRFVSGLSIAFGIAILVESAS